MNDDAEFAAFLKGEGGLSRQLQAIGQQEPSAQLDSAILNRARLAMAQETHPAAANDPGAQAAAPQLAPPFGYRWRVPVGIAATLLAGVFASQSFQRQEDAAAAALAAETAAPAPVMVTLPNENVAAAPPMLEVPPVLRSAPAPRPALERAPVAAEQPLAAAAPPPPPPPVADATPMPSATPAPVVAMPAPVPVPAPAPAYGRSPAPASAPMPVTARARSETDLARKEAAAGLAAETERKADARADRSERVSVTGSRIMHPESKAWIAQIEGLLKAGENDKARREWQAFRDIYPREKVAPELEDRLEALSE